MAWPVTLTSDTDEEGGESERIRGVRGGVAVCVDGFVARHEMECSSVGS